MVEKFLFTFFSEWDLQDPPTAFFTTQQSNDQDGISQNVERYFNNILISFYPPSLPPSFKTIKPINFQMFFFNLKPL
jgi:hypothetical protein